MLESSTLNEEDLKTKTEGDLNLKDLSKEGWKAKHYFIGIALFIILLLGGMIWKHSIKKVVEKVPDAIYIIVGSGSNEGELQNLVNELNLEKQVFFAGRVNDKDLPSYFQLCDVYSHAPRATDGAYPGFEMVYVEAGCAGKPVVGAKSGGTPSAVIDGETGYLVPEEDVDSLAERLVEILQDKELANRFAECNKQFAKERDWKNIVGQHVDLYKSLLFDKI